ncbi:hypothetical protein BSL78_21231 [Apostichopus japonicus]|uniref:Uncharacterized protein n=1 Tax=Stichopus japonicus TaxID=307972 RepID=A0A2G8K1R9_STIJA|nr:hypothetical protein BSL78_21231 [Apostichopus japonicus]
MRSCLIYFAALEFAFVSAPAAKKRSSTLDEDYLLLEDAVPVKKSRSDVDEQFEDEELDEDALLGLSDNDEPYEGDGGTELDVTLASNEPELDDDGGYSVYPEDKGLEDDSYEVSQEFDEEPGEEFTAEEGTAEEYTDEVYTEETTEEYPEEESYQEEADDHKTGGEDEYKEETSEDVAVETTDESSFFDVLDIDITDDSLIKELEEEEDFAQTSSSGGTFVKPAEPPPIFSTPKTTPKTTPQKLTAPKTPVQVKDTTSKVHPQETEIPKVTTSRAKVGNAEDEDEEEDEERETRGDRFKSERKEMVSLKSGSRNRNIPDTLVLSEAAQKELAEYERQEQEEKQRRMQRRQGWRGGRGGRGGPRGHFQRGRGGGFYNNRGRMPLFGPPRFDTRPLFFPRNPMRGFHEPRRFNPVPLIPIVPLQVQPPLITLTNASFTEDDMVDSFGNGRPHRDSPPRQPHQALLLLSMLCLNPNSSKIVPLIPEAHQNLLSMSTLTSKDKDLSFPDKCLRIITSLLQTSPLHIRRNRRLTKLLLARFKQ